MMSDPSTSSPSRYAAGPSIGSSTVRETARERGSVIAVYGSRADVGVSTIASSLAAALLSMGVGRIALAELDPRAGRAKAGVDGATSTSRAVKTSPEPSAADRVAIPSSDAGLTPRSDGVWTFAAGQRTTPVVSDAKSVSVVLDALRGQFGVSVAELEHQVNERTLAAFDAADRIVIVTQGSVPSLRGTQRVLRLCRRLNYPDEKLCVVVNCYDAQGSLQLADIAAILKREVYWKIAVGDSAEVSGLAEKLIASS